MICRRSIHLSVLVVATVIAAMCLPGVACGQSLQARLEGVGVAELAARARSEGDAARGALTFFRPPMACGQCHSVGEGGDATIGPDLAAPRQHVGDELLVESLLWPSKQLSPGYETVAAQSVDGATKTGLLVEANDERLIIREATNPGGTLTLSMDDVEAWKRTGVSLMPAGHADLLGGEQQFLDLVRYLIEIRDGGPAKARELQPTAAQLAIALPEYESRVDHAGLIGEWDANSLERGEAIYRRVCQSCHGTVDAPGSLPTSLRFGAGKFKAGSDPLSMYRTLSHGFGAMAPQSWMVPRQKYDVIHYIREAYLRPHNPSQLTSIDEGYLANLPKGDTFGPEPSEVEPWNAMDYGPHLSHTYEVPTRDGDRGQPNIAYKGIAIRLDEGAGGVARGRHWMLFDVDTLRMAAAWSAPVPGGEEADENFIDWRGIQFNGEHAIHPSLEGGVAAANRPGPGWADPATGSFADDARVLGRDGRRYGPLPRGWGRFRGIYHHGQHVVLHYSVDGVDVRESPRLLTVQDTPVFVRVLNIGQRDRELTLQIAERSRSMRVGFASHSVDSAESVDAGDHRVSIPAGRQPVKLVVYTAEQAENESFDRSIRSQVDQLNSDLSAFTNGGPSKWPEVLTTTIVPHAGPGSSEAFTSESLSLPLDNPWLCQVRPTGLDFLSDGRLAVCTWDGDVWLVSEKDSELAWRRIASGLFQPLGLKVVGGRIHLTCRDGLVVLHDLNGDEETDYYEYLNTDHQVTEHFHEFAMGLQVDGEGNFYYAKSARHALPAVVPHHGTLLKISSDGSKTEIVANGFRAANGVCLNPDGSFVVTDQEGHWNPKNRINWVTPGPGGKPRFYGNLFGYTDITDRSDEAMEPPLCWITNKFDRSPGELLWLDHAAWGPLRGSLLNLSYGTGELFIVPHERVDGVVQGGMLRLPIATFPTGVMRGRLHPEDGSLYACGMFAWAGDATTPGGLYRIRPTGEPMHLASELHATRQGLTIAYTEPLDPASVAAENVGVETWALKRTANYGSKHYDERQLEVTHAELSADGRTVRLTIPEIAPCWCMEIDYRFRAATGDRVEGVIQNTVHRLSDPTAAAYRSPLLFEDGTPVQTPADWERRREEISKYWHGVMGQWPPLIERPRIETLETTRRENFTQHRVSIEVAPERTQEGYLLVPDGEGPFPGVVVPYYEPETSIGLNAEKNPLRDFAYQLTKRGFVTLSIGSPGGDAWHPDTAGQTLQPLSYLAYIAANCHTALASLPQVDAERIGIVGHSYGGKWAMFASCLYEPFAAAAWSDGGIVWDEARSNVNYWEPWYLGRDADFTRQPGLVTADNPRTGAYKRLVESGHDLHELHSLMAPRPFLVSGGSEDPPSRWLPLNHAVAVNQLLGQKDRVAMTNRETHTPTAESNEAIYQFFERYLKRK